MHLRDATPADVDLIARLHAESWRSAYAAILDPGYLAERVDGERRQAWADRFGSPSPTRKVVVAEADGEAAGFACAFGVPDDRWGTLVDNLHVRPSLKRRGTGTLLLAAIASWARAAAPDAGMHLWCFERNEAARRFYEARGGRVVERAAHAMFGGAPQPSLRLHWTDLEVLARCEGP